MKISEFAGIKSFHDGMSVSEYTNMIPMDNSCIDRVGEKMLFDRTTKDPVIQTFVDSLKNIYIATTKRVIRLRYNPITKLYRPQSLDSAWGSSNGLEYIGADSRVISNVTFCESTTKPSQVYMCDGQYVYYWNTAPIVSDQAIADIQAQWPDEHLEYRVIDYVANLLPVGDFTDFNATIYFRDSTPGSESGYGYGWWPELYDGTWQPLATNYAGELWNISSITWYENRLVLVQKDKNTVRLSTIRPDRWIIPTFDDIRQIWQPFQIFTLNNGNLSDKRYCFVPHAYISTASASLLQDAVAFGGQLYFLNDTTIEIWTNTYNEDAPIQHNSLSTIHYGGRSPCIVADAMYLICKDTWHNDFIAVIGTNGQMQKISNDEIEKRLAGNAAIIRPISVRDNSFVIVYCSDPFTGVDLRRGYSVTKSGKWWTYDNRYLDGHIFAVWSVMTQDGVQIDVGNHGELIAQDQESRQHVDGTTVTRFIRGCFTQLPGRVIVREVEVVCDTGVSYIEQSDDSKLKRGSIYLRLSFDRGLSFGKYLYRTMGEPGKNDRRLVWRNCGSGNSFLMEFGTSDNVRFQLYEIDFELQ